MEKINNILNCNHSNLFKSRDVMHIKNKYLEMETETCKKCGEIFTSAQETERIRRLVNPSLFDRIKNKLKKPKSNINILKGRVL